MAGRNSPNSGDGGRREQAPKNPRGFARGHGSHHRPNKKGAPRQIGSGRDRTGGDLTRNKRFDNLDDDALHDLQNMEKTAEVERSVQDSGEARGFGAEMKGTRVPGIVVEVRKGNFLTRMLDESTEVNNGGADAGKPRWKKGEVLRTIARGMLQQFDMGLSSLVAPGDDVEVIVPPMAGQNELFQAGLHAVLVNVKKRRSEFRRVHSSGRSIQTLAANVDRVVIVASAAEPDFRPGFVDRVLVCAAASGLPAALVVNKIDLGLDEDDIELLDVYRKLNVPVFEISAQNPSLAPDAMEDLKALMAGHRNLLTGHSGVGKSSLMLALDPLLDPDTVRTGDVSTQTKKGTHTTTHAHLFPVGLGDGRTAEVIDTPGVREFTPADTDRRNLWGWFPELAALQGQCAYPDCTHTVAKGCAVLAAVERGEIHERRHQSYVRIYETLPS